MTSSQKRILSCIQPTGEMHIGNYFGAIQNWVKLQGQYDCIYGIVDYHAMTMPYNPEQLRASTIRMAVDLIACGINPENLFIQSLIPEHTELSWILACVTSYGELSRQVQFKDKSLQNDSFISAGLFTYPVLQAADILIYKADLVPVGRDQEQHLELARNVALRFNHNFNCEYFIEPECLFTEIPKVMSLANPEKKMSKSLGQKHYIALFEEEKILRDKVKRAVTAVTGDEQQSPGVENLFRLLLACGAEQEYKHFTQEMKRGALKFSELKESLANGLVAMTADFRQKRSALLANLHTIEERIFDVSSDIRTKAQNTLHEVREITGLTKLSYHHKGYASRL